MKRLPPSDLRHLTAAEGWPELGNHFEANEELERITPQQCAFLWLEGRVWCLQRSQMSVTITNNRQPTTHSRVVNRQRKAK